MCVNGRFNTQCGANWARKYIHLKSTFCVVLVIDFVLFHLVFWETHKMDLKQNLLYNSHYLLKRIVFFKNVIFSNLCSFEWKFSFKYFVKSHKWNFSYGNKSIQSIHIQCMIKYFINLGNHNCLNDFKDIYTLLYIVINIMFSQIHFLIIWYQ